MEKRISYSQFMQVKSAAKMIDPIRRKMEPIKAKITALAEEYKKNETQINALEKGIVEILGFHVSDLVKKVIESGVDGKGNAVKITKYVPTDIVTYDSVKKQFVITLPEPIDHYADNQENQENVSGSDFDADAERISAELASGPSAEEIFQ